MYCCMGHMSGLSPICSIKIDSVDWTLRRCATGLHKLLFEVNENQTNTFSSRVAIIGPWLLQKSLLKKIFKTIRAHPSGVYPLLLWPKKVVRSKTHYDILRRPQRAAPSNAVSHCRLCCQQKMILLIFFTFFFFRGIESCLVFFSHGDRERHSQNAKNWKAASWHARPPCRFPSTNKQKLNVV